MTPSAHTPPDAPAPWLDGKKVVVTGGTGFVGRHLLPQLLAAGARHLCRTPRDIPAALEELRHGQ